MPLVRMSPALLTRPTSASTSRARSRSIAATAATTCSRTPGSLDGLDFYYRDFYDGLGADALDVAFATVEPSYRGRVRMVAAAEPAPARWLDVGGGHGHFCLVAAEDLPDTSTSTRATPARPRGVGGRGPRGSFVDLDPIAGTSTW